MTGSSASDKTPVSNKAINMVDGKAVSITTNVDHENPSSHKVVEPASNKTLNQTDFKTCKPANNNGAESDAKEKVTFNLSNSTIQALDDAWILLRRSKLRDMQRITKTLIVEVAVKLALAELDEKGELSDLYRALKI